MTGAPLSPIDDRPDLLSGNLGKVRVICELARRLQQDANPLRVLDVGCVGPHPFNQWDYLFARYPGRIELTASTYEGSTARERSPANAVRGRAGRSERLRAVGAPRPHVRDRGGDAGAGAPSPPRRLPGAARTRAGSGRTGVPTLDSGHFDGHHGARERLRDLLAPVLPERYHDRGLTAEEVARLARDAALRVEDLRPAPCAAQARPQPRTRARVPRAVPPRLVRVRGVALVGGTVMETHQRSAGCTSG